MAETGSVEVGKKKVEENRAPEVKVEVKKIEGTKAPEKPKTSVFKEDSWMYHKVHEPKLFKKGEETPAEWSHINSFGWYKDPLNNFHWAKK